MLAPLGETVLAAAGLGMAGATLAFAALYGLLSVVGVRVARARGERRGRAVSGLIKSGLGLGLFAGTLGAAAMGAAWHALAPLQQPEPVLAILGAYWALLSLTLLPFALLSVLKFAFEASGHPWTAAGFAFLGAGVNIPLNYLLIYGSGPVPALGLTGAGLATLLAESLAFAAAWVFWRTGRRVRRLRARTPGRLHQSASAALEGAPLGFLYVAEQGAASAAVIVIGWFGATALAANQVVVAVAGLLYMAPLGLAAAVALRVAEAAGAGRRDELRGIAVAVLLLTTALGASSMTAILLGGETIAHSFLEDEATARLATQLFIVVAAMQIVDGVQSAMVGALRGLSDTVAPSLVSIFAYWAVALPLGWALAHPLGLGPTGVWIGFAGGLAVAALALSLRFWHKTA
jgi:MATE family multidrug resistance protein